MAQSSLPPQTPHASHSHAAVVEDPATGTVDVETGEKVSTVETGVAAATRLDAVDLLRGLVMVIMALDHARFFLHEAALLYPVSDFALYRRPVFDIAFLTQSPPPAGYGYSLAVVYLVWIGVVLALYPLCRWFAGVKRRRRAVWLSYL